MRDVLEIKAMDFRIERVEVVGQVQGLNVTFSPIGMLPFTDGSVTVIVETRSGRRESQGGAFYGPQSSMENPGGSRVSMDNSVPVGKIGLIGAQFPMGTFQHCADVTISIVGTYNRVTYVHPRTLKIKEYQRRFERC